MAALIIAIFPQNSSRGNWEEQQDRTDPNSRFELARKPAWLLAFRQFGLPKWKHDFEFCVPNAVCAPPGPKQAVSSRPFWPRHADFRRIRPQNRVGTSKSIVLPFGAKSNDFWEKCKIPCKITGRTSGPPGQVLASLSLCRISPQARKSPRNPRILSYRYGFSGSKFHQRRIRP